MDRRCTALVLLLAFIACIGVAVLGALAVLVLLDLLVAHGPNIGAGLVQLVGELVILVATVRLAVGIARAGRAR